MDIGAVFVGLTALIGQCGMTYVIVSRSNRESRESREDRARNAAVLQAHLEKQDVKLVELHNSTNGKMEELLALTAKVSKAEGKAAEKANPT